MFSAISRLTARGAPIFWGSLFAFLPTSGFSRETPPSLEIGAPTARGLERMQRLSGTGSHDAVAAADGRSAPIVLAQNDRGVRSDATGPEALPAIDVAAQAAAGDGKAGNGEGSGPGGRFTGYAATSASSATKTLAPIMKVPMAVTVVSRQVMDEQQVVDLHDALKNVSGVFRGGDFSYDGIMLRGFISDNLSTVYRNGLRTYRAANEPANLQSLEVVKGPASVLYGRLEPGGLVNLKTKRPLDAPYYSVQQQFGSFAFYRTTVDATGPLTNDKSLLYRVNLAYKTNDAFIDLVDQERLFIAPSLLWSPTENAALYVDLEYKRDRSRYYYGIPAFGNRPAPVPRETYLGFGSSSDLESQTLSRLLVSSNGYYTFDNDWRLTERFQWYRLEYDTNNTYYGEDGVAEDGRSFSRYIYTAPVDQASIFAGNLDLTGKFATAGAEHDFLVGFDYFNQKQWLTGFIGDPTDIFGASFPTTIDIYNPVRVQAPYPSPAQFNSFTKRGQEWVGAYFQDQITLWDRLHILGGGRFDWANVISGSASDIAEYRNLLLQVTPEHAFSPRVGVLYQIEPWLSVYGSYSEAFSASNGRGFGDVVLPAQTAEQFEAGAKALVLDGRLLATLALFDLTKQNLRLADPAHPGYSIAIGEARSRGVELDISGQVTESLNVIASYAATDAKITKDSKNQGHHLYGAPAHAGSVWASYEIKAGDLAGLSFGAGVFAAGERQGDNANSYQLPAYATVDIGAGYSWKFAGVRYEARLKINNLLDAYYFAWPGHGDRAGAMPGPPRTVLGSIRAEF